MYSASQMLAKASEYHKVTYLEDREFYRNEYLASGHWKRLRKKKLKINPECETCGRKGKVDIHHLNYKRLYNVKTSDLKTLCRGCHIEVHKKKESSKRKKKKEKTIDEICHRLKKLPANKKETIFKELKSKKYRIKMGREEMERIFNELKQ